MSSSSDRQFAKLDRQLRDLVTQRAAAEEVVPVMIRFAGEAPAVPEDLTRAGRVAWLAAAFDAQTRELVELLKKLGAKSITPLWLNRSIAARLPLAAVLAVANEDSVVQILLDIKRKAIDTRGGRHGR